MRTDNNDEQLRQPIMTTSKNDDQCQSTMNIQQSTKPRTTNDNNHPSMFTNAKEHNNDDQRKYPIMQLMSLM